MSTESRSIYRAHKRDGAPLGGSDAGPKRDAIVAAMSAIRDAVAAVAETAPNGRDYLPATYALETIASRSRLARLCSVQNELDDLFRVWSQF